MNYEYQCTMNISCSKSSHLSNSNIIGRFFLHFLKNNSVCDDFSKLRVPNVLQNSEKSSNIAKIWGNEENLAIFTTQYSYGRFWNQKCSQCSGWFHEIGTSKSSHISNAQRLKSTFFEIFSSLCWPLRAALFKKISKSNFTTFFCIFGGF